MLPNRDSYEYIDALSRVAALPAGFGASVSTVTFPSPSDEGPQAMHIALVAADVATDAFALMFTRNAVVGHPVRYGREIVDAGRLRGVLVNNRVANVGTPNGEQRMMRLVRATEAAVGASAGEILPVSTGVIGWELPVDEMERGLPAAPEAGAGDALSFARAIMTTDRYPKLAMRRVGDGSVVAVAKGAGMIEPNMGTMLAFILTDVVVDRDALRSITHEAVEHSFNRISVDGDTSTSDTVVAISSGRVEARLDVVSRAIHEVCDELADLVVRNGEGTSHVVEVRVAGAADRPSAHALARRVANSPLVKTAIAGNDPNVGRILAALGAGAAASGIALAAESIDVDVCGEPVARGGAVTMTRDGEERIGAELRRTGFSPDDAFPTHDLRSTIEIRLGLGDAEEVVIGSDLTDEYVRINGAYRS